MRSKIVVMAVAFGVFVTLLAGLSDPAVFASDDDEALPPVPKEYADKHMAKGGWTDPAMIAAGKKIFEEKQKKIELEGKDQMVECATCHGKDGKPKKRGVKNMSSPKVFNRYSDSFWFWRISEGVPKTKMKAWKEDLTEQERWQVMAYEHTFSHGGKAEPHEHPEIGK